MYESLPVVLLSIIGILYIFGLLKYLLLGVYGVVLLAIGLGLITIVQLVRNKELIDFFKHYFKNGFFLFSIIYFLFAITTYGKMFNIWDEYTLWSIASKNMYYLNDFVTNINSTVYTMYPPSPTILQYLFCKVLNIYSQGIELFASQILGFTLLFPLLKNTDKKLIKCIIVGIILCIPAIFVESLFYYTIYVDTVLGLLVAYILFEYFTTEKADAFLYVSMSVAMVVLSLTKSTGFFYSNNYYWNVRII